MTELDAQMMDELHQLRQAIAEVPRRPTVLNRPTETDLEEWWDEFGYLVPGTIEHLTAKGVKPITENFPKTIEQEEAEIYSVTGQQMMLNATPLKLDEGTQHRLSCLMIGLTSALCSTLHVPRDPFCTQLVTNVMFSALKAAFKLGSPNDERGDA